MIFFKNLSIKNFLSTGNAEVVVDLDASSRVLVVGQNGNGKSLIFNALSFVLFNKPIKNLNKPGLINSINNKNCLVTVNFTIGSKEFLVKRGIKPNIFEIWEDGQMLDQTAVNDYQAHLEEKILCTNFRAFTQTTIVSIENYVPFMKLRAHERREFIEELLDINVFSTMNLLLKQHMNEVKEDYRLIDVSLKSIKDKATLQKDHIKQLEKIRDSQVADLKTEVKQYKEKITAVDLEAKHLNEVIKTQQSTIADLNKKNDRLVKMNQMRDELLSDLRKIIKEESFYHDADNCPTCKQGIDTNHKQQMESVIVTKKETVERNIKSVDAKIAEYATVRTELNDANLELQKLNTQLSAKVNSKQIYMQSIDSLNDQIDRHNHNNESINEQKEVLQKIAKEALDLTKRRSELSEQIQYQDIAYGLLKDTGIKAKIIKQYVPVINKLVNKYLAMMDFFVSFELDENFNESIKSRHRDTFTYFNFSAGEQLRIDTALMITFRQIAKMKNSFNCNLLCLDEVLDRIDGIGFDLVMQIFDSEDFANTNLFVVSHKSKDLLAEMFPTTLEVSKDQYGFTEINIT